MLSFRYLCAALAASFSGQVAFGDCDPVTLSLNGNVFGPNETIEVTIQGVPGTSAFLLVDTALGPTVLPGIGTVALALSSDLMVIAAPPLSETGSVLCAVAPGCPFALLGIPLFVQAVAVDLAEPEVCFSNVETLLVADLYGECDGVAGEGCTPGFWKNHPEAWAVTGYSPGDDFDATFGIDVLDPNLTLIQVLQPPTPIQAIGFHAVAALLNASHPETTYPLTSDQVIQLVADAFGSGDPDLIEEVKNLLADLNEAGCPF